MYMYMYIKYINMYMYNWAESERAPHLSVSLKVYFVCIYIQVYIVRHSVLSLFVRYVFRKYLNVQIFKHFKLKFSKATCVSLLDTLSYGLRKRRARDRAKRAAETKEKRETRLSKRREASFVLKFRNHSS